jgi:hypothetical protein
VNRELFQKIHDIIAAQTAERRVHYQQTWESQGSCGTTRCVAGWAIHLTTGEPVFVHDSAITPPAHLSPSLVELARTRGISADSGDADYFDLIPLLARDLLGLTEKDAYTLFFVADTPEARTAVRMAAHGDEQGFRQLLRSIRDEREFGEQYREVFQ